MQKAVYYARVSTEEKHQSAAIVTRCMGKKEFINSREDWLLIDKYTDERKSGTTMEGRSELIRMLDVMETDKFDIRLIKKIVRGWRNLGDWKVVENILEKSGVKLLIIFKYMEMFFSPKRFHSALGYKSIMEYERLNFNH